MKVSLVVLTPGNSKGKTIPILRFPFLIGRDPKCNLRPASPVISNRHCTLELRGGKVFLTDLKSTNGTYVNDQRTEADRELKPGDRIGIGPLSFGVQIELTPAVDKPTPLPSHRASNEPADDEAIAAVLLSMQDGDSPAAGSEVDSAGIPTGGTKVQDGQSSAGDSTIIEPAPTKDGKDEKKKDKVGAGDTAVVAGDLLMKYLRRPRKKE
jgi:predicted component of type VI protein secretion system